MRSPHWRKYFDFTPIDGNRTNGRCKLCKENYKDVKGVYSNFLKHLRRKHVPEFLKMFPSHEKDSAEDMDVVNGESSKEQAMVQPNVNRVSFAITKYLIIKCNMPLNLVENSAFREFMKECHVKWNYVSAKAVKKNILPSFREKVDKSIQQMLSVVDHVTLTIDAWTDKRSRSFLGITAHFIDPEMEPQSCLIDFVRFRSPHTAENIYRTTEFILDHANIKEKVFRIVTDNASSMVKAYKFGLGGDDSVDDEETRPMTDVKNLGDDDEDEGKLGQCFLFEKHEKNTEKDTHLNFLRKKSEHSLSRSFDDEEILLSLSSR